MSIDSVYKAGFKATVKNLDGWIKDLADLVTKLRTDVDHLKEENQRLRRANEQAKETNNRQAKDIAEFKKAQSAPMVALPALDWSKAAKGKSNQEEAYLMARVSRESKEKAEKDKNILVSGINESVKATVEEQHEEDEGKIESLAGHLSLPKNSIRMVRRLRKREGDTRPALLVVSFKDSETQKTAIKNARLLRQSTDYNNVYINKDLTENERLLDKELRKQRDKRNSELEDEDDDGFKYGNHKGKQFFWGIRNSELKRIDKGTRRILVS